MIPDLYLRNGRVISAAGDFPGGLVVHQGRIAQLVPNNPDLPATAQVDVGGQWLLPGLIDAHVHFSEPGREHWEGWATGTQAAAAGGVTTVIEMPLNASPPTINRAALQAKQAAAARSALVDYALWGGLVDNNLADLDELYAGGVVGFKAFLCESATDFARIDDDLLYLGLEKARELGTLVGVHAENEWVTRTLAARLQAAGRVDRRAWGEARPPAAELEAIQRAILWAETTGARLHIVHVSQAAGIRAARAAQARGVAVTVETCPHYLCLDEEDFVRIGPAAKCAPPLRPRAEVEALWQALLDGQVDMIASDHSPCTWPEKARGEQDIWQAWGGISALQSTLSLLVTEGVQRRGLDPAHLVRMVATNPARIFGLYPQKGSLLPGSDADIVVFDPEASYRLTSDMLFYKHRHSPYVGQTLQGVVKTTYLRGAPVYRDGAICANAGVGQLVRPGPSG